MCNYPPPVLRAKLNACSGYIVGALRQDRSLPYDIDSLVELVHMSSSCWAVHGQWVLQQKNKTLRATVA